MRDIRLIASDIDGTLLPEGTSILEDGIIDEIFRLRKKGILFVPTSGRQLRTLRNLFSPCESLLPFVADNGSLVYGDGKHELLAYTEMERSRTLDLAEEIVSYEGVEVLVSGDNMSYMMPKKDTILRLVRDQVGNNVTLINSFDEITEPIVKVSAFDERGVVELEGKMKSRWEKYFSVAVAGRFWLDFNLADKGTGLTKLCSLLGVPLSSVMAFGDNYNDMPMLSIVGHPYLMEKSNVRDVPSSFMRTDSVRKVLATL